MLKPFAIGYFEKRNFPLAKLNEKDKMEKLNKMNQLTFFREEVKKLINL